MNALINAFTALSGQQLLALLEMSITCSILLIWLSKFIFTQSLSLINRISLMFGLTLILFLPSEYWNYFGIPLELPLAAYVRGIVGDLSVITLVLLWSSFILNERLALPLQVKLSLACIAVIFYPLALGFTMFDPYAWGYGCLLYTSPSPRDRTRSRMPSSA